VLFSLIVLRIPELQWKALEALPEITYKYKAVDEDAPRYANCVTAVRYLLENCAGKRLPNEVWIGDMPRHLFAHGCTIHQVSTSSLQAGDLIFLRQFPSNTMRKTRRYISHLMIALGPHTIFHCAEKRGRATSEILIGPYAQELLARAIDLPALFLRYIDPRNTPFRTHFGTELIPFPILRPIGRLKPAKTSVDFSLRLFQRALACCKKL